MEDIEFAVVTGVYGIGLVLIMFGVLSLLDIALPLTIKLSIIAGVGLGAATGAFFGRLFRD